MRESVLPVMSASSSYEFISQNISELKRKLADDVISAMTYEGDVSGELSGVASSIRTLEAVHGVFKENGWF